MTKTGKNRSEQSAQRKSLAGLASGLALGLAFFAAILTHIPTVSPGAMVRAQIVHGQAINAAPASSAPPAAPMVVAIGKNSYLDIGFDLLSSFPFAVTPEMGGPNTPNSQKLPELTAANEKITAQIPDNIKALNQKQVALKGYMLPVVVKGGLVEDFVLLRSQRMCCYGVVPKLNEWVYIHMAGKGIKAAMDQPLTFFGTMQVGEIRENGMLIGIYKLIADKMAGPGES